MDDIEQFEVKNNLFICITFVLFIDSLPTNNPNFWSNGGNRKRKAAASDLDEK
jgi:hypothetical protein